MSKKIESSSPSKTIKTDFISELDQMFHEFDRQRTLFPVSRLEEIQKHLLIATKRNKS